MSMAKSGAIVYCMELTTKKRRKWPLDKRLHMV